MDTALFDEAYKLPPGRYYVSDKVRDFVKYTALTGGMGHIAISNSTSEVPIVGSCAFNPCCCLILYNTRTKTAVVGHEVHYQPDVIANLKSKVISKEGDIIHAYIMGNPKSTKMDNTTLFKHYLNDLLTELAAEPPVQVKVFDVLDKPKPTCAALDTRNGRLIRGTNLYRTEEEANIIQRPDMSDEVHVIFNDDFDGTTPDMQKPVRGRAPQ